MDLGRPAPPLNLNLRQLQFLKINYVYNIILYFTMLHNIA